MPDGNELRLMDAARQSLYNYWSALLTVNSILIASYSTIAFVRKDGKILILILVGSAILASFLLIKNFMRVKELYQFLGRLSDLEVERMTDAEKAAQLEKQEAENKAMENRNIWIERLLFLQAVLILVVIFLA